MCRGRPAAPASAPATSSSVWRRGERDQNYSASSTTAACSVVEGEAITGTRCSPRCGCLAVRDYYLHPADHSAYQAHFYAVRVSGRIGENLVNGSFCQFPGTLILFLHDLHPGSRVDASSSSPVHLDSPGQLVERPRRPTPLPVSQSVNALSPCGFPQSVVQMRSTMVAIPWPTPMHMVARP